MEKKTISRSDANIDKKKQNANIDVNAFDKDWVEKTSQIANLTERIWFQFLYMAQSEEPKHEFDIKPSISAALPGYIWCCGLMVFEN